MIVAIVALLLSVATGLGAFVVLDRRHRQAWSRELPAESIDASPYRATTVIPGHENHAPLRVRIAAFSCLWIGQGAFVVILVPSLFVTLRSLPRLFIGLPPANPLDFLHGAGTVVWRTGGLLLARDPRTLPSALLVEQFGRLLSLGLIAFASFGLYSHASLVWWSILGFGVALFLHVAMVRWALRIHASLFDPRVDLPEPASNRAE